MFWGRLWSTPFWDKSKDCAGVGSEVSGDPGGSSSPNFLRKWYRAIRETRTPKVRSMKSIRSARVALGLLKMYPRDRSSVTRQEFAIGAAIHAVMSLLDRLLGRQVLLPRGSLPAEVSQASNLGDLESTLAMEKEMAEQAIGVVIGPLLLPEAEDILEQAA